MLEAGFSHLMRRVVADRTVGLGQASTKRGEGRRAGVAADGPVAAARPEDAPPEAAVDAPVAGEKGRQAVPGALGGGGVAADARAQVHGRRRVRRDVERRGRRLRQDPAVLPDAEGPLAARRRRLRI